MAAALQFLQEYGLTDYDELAAKTDAAVDQEHTLAGELRAVQDYPLPQRVLVSADRANKGLRFHLVSSFHCKINTDAEDSGGSGQQELNKRVPLAAVLIEIALVCFSFP